MFERLKSALNRRTGALLRSPPLVQWALQNSFEYTPAPGGGFSLTGEWWGRPVRLECAPSSRTYIDGPEFMARVDLGRATPGGVVLMTRLLKHRLEGRANELYSQYTDTLKTTAQAVPEEIRWLSMYRDAGWAGPDRHFWARYSVLTDVPDAAREWLDDESLDRLMRWPGHVVGVGTPLMAMILKGKAYMRLQLDDPRDSATVLHAIELFRHLAEQARRVQAYG